MYVLKIVIAPNALKDSLSAIEAAEAIKTGVLKADSQIDTVCIPIADGGDGLLLVLKNALKGEWRTIAVSNPLGQSIQASFLYCPSKSLAIIELASAAGLGLLDESEYDVKNASTYGVGQLINAALELNIERLILGIGGSATNDGAMGIASALGVRFSNKNGELLKGCGNHLIELNQIDLSQVNKKIGSIKFDVVCDVKNTLLGKFGAAEVFSPQKGASSDDVVFLEKGLAHFSQVIETSLGVNIRELKGGGAAGGVGAGLNALFNANLCSGAELVLDLLCVERDIQDADLLITAEGKIDSQTAYGKAPFVVAQLAKKYDVPVFVIAGQVELDEGLSIFDKVFTLTSKNISSEYAMSHAASLIEKTSEGLMIDFFGK